MTEKRTEPMEHPVMKPIRDLEKGDRLECVIEDSSWPLIKGDIVTVDTVHKNAFYAFVMFDDNNGRIMYLDSRHFKRV